MTKDELIAQMVDRFLQWKLPASVCSDTCVSDRTYAERYPEGRSGTNLLTADEAQQMIKHVIVPALAAAEKVRAEEAPAPLSKWDVEAIAHIIDPEAFGLPTNIEEGTITDRDEARDRARIILRSLAPAPARTMMTHYGDAIARLKAERDAAVSRAEKAEAELAAVKANVGCELLAMRIDRDSAIRRANITESQRDAAVAEAVKLDVRVAELVERVNAHSFEKMLSSADLKAAEKHCEWVAFQHAWNAVMNARAAL
jgi:hypothetical protein